MPQRERWQAVQDILKDLRGLDPLKRLFWSELNYDRVNHPLSRGAWSKTASKSLAEDPVLFAAHQAFHIIYGRLNSDSLLLGQERHVVSRLLQDHPYALFVFSNAAQDRWHIVNVKMADDPKNRRLFRRFTIGPNERLRTASERIALLDVGDRKQSPLEVQELHDDAFNVEAVTKQFFATFAELYHKVADDIREVRGLEEEAGRLAQLLLDRLIFLYFIQKKAWLDSKPDYLYARFLDIWKKTPKGSNYYSDVLYPLFLCLSDADVKIHAVGAVPFLNGGLFEESVTQAQAKRLALARLSIKNATFKVIFDDLLERFNFTISEVTPLDVEVAIDPEMLGKIFESLILELEKDPDKDLRRLTGSYYTPRPIVQFMCREALKEYLVRQLAEEDSGKAEGARSKVETLLDLPKADQLDEEQIGTLNQLFTKPHARTLRQAILDCRVCDPAVGSGAYPVGMLHEMVAAIGRLDVRLDGPKAIQERNYDYALKKQIIESCLYGVDIQEQAVRLCELRLWLSLVVDYQIDPDRPFAQAIREVPNLPNLSYRIMRGDSLLERLFGHVVQLDQMARDEKALDLIEAIQRDKQAYFREGRTAQKRHLEVRILAKQADLAERLIEAKRAAVKGYQASMFREDELSPRERKARAEHEEQLRHLDDLKKKVAVAKDRVERLARQKTAPSLASLDALRRQYFQGGDAPTFMWRVDFAEIFCRKSGFDVVIANPPYVSFYSRESAAPATGRADAISIVYGRGLSGRTNLFLAFVLLARQLLDRVGQLAFIVPDTLATNESYKPTRVTLWNAPSNLRVVEVLFSVFPDPTVRNILLFAVPGGPDLQVAQATSLTAVEQPRLVWASVPRNTVEADPALRFVARSDRAQRVMRTIESSGLTLASVAVVRDGVNPGPRAFRDEILSDIPRGHNWQPVLVGGDISRYIIRRPSLYIHYEPNLLTPDLKKQGASFRDPTIFSQRRLVSRQTAKELIFAIDDLNRPTLNSVHNTLLRSGNELSLEALMAVLNCRPLNWYYRLRFRENRDVFPQVHIAALRQLPLPNLSQDEIKQLHHLAVEATKQAQDNERVDSAILLQIDAVIARSFGVESNDLPES